MRPEKFTHENRRLLLVAFRLRLSVADAAGHAGVAASTVNRWLKDDAPRFREFQREVAQARAMPLAACSAVVLNAAKAGSWKAARAFMAAHDPNWAGIRNQRELELRLSEGIAPPAIHYHYARDESDDPAAPGEPVH